MTSDVPDPLNCEGDTLYSIYRKGLITRHIAVNGRFLETIALERIDDSGRAMLQSGQFIDIEHSAPFGRGRQNITIRIPKANARYSDEIDANAPLDNGNYAVKPHVWVPLISPVKYPGAVDHVRRLHFSGISPWFPQAHLRKPYSMQKTYYVTSSERSDNPGYYGGMALAAFALEALYSVSPYSIDYARKLMEGFLAMEMNDRNGYLIRYDRWHTKPGEEKEIRGASAEELLGIMLGIMFYLEAEQRCDPNHPLVGEATNLRDRILQRVSDGTISDNYSHPFMAQSYYVKTYEAAFYAAKGVERGSEWLYRQGLYLGVTSWIGEEKHLQNMAMGLYSIILILAGGLPDIKKEEWARVFLYFVKKTHYNNGEKVRRNLFLGLVSLLINRYLNPQRDCFFKSQQMLDIWTDFDGDGEKLDIAVWDEMVDAVLHSIAFPQSQGNERSLVNGKFLEEASKQWQHNLPLLTVLQDGQPLDWRVSDASGNSLGWLWKPHNPHQRIGKLFPWKEGYPYWWRAGQWKFCDFAIGWESESHLNEVEYLQTDTAKRYDGNEYLIREVLGYRHHQDTQIEAAGMDLLFMRMLLTHIAGDTFPPPQLPDKDTLYPVLPFRGVEPLDPKFLHYRYHFSTANEDWEIGGDKERSLGVASFPIRDIIVTASADRKETLWLDSWRLTGSDFVHLRQHKERRFDQVVLRKTSSTGNPDFKDILVMAERAEVKRTGQKDDHFLRLSMYQVRSDGALLLLTSQRISRPGSDVAQILDMCILNYKYAGITYKTSSGRARVKILVLDFASNRIVEQNDFIAELGTREGHQKIENVVWIGSAWDDILINGYMSKADPYNHFKLYSRSITDLHTAYCVWDPAVKGQPIDALTVQSGGKYYLVTASYYPCTSGASGRVYPRFSMNSWEIAKDGQLFHKGVFTEHETDLDKQYLFTTCLDFDRLAMSRTRFGEDGEFVIAAKGFTNNWRSLSDSNQGLIVLYGKVLNNGQPTLIDWNCAGSGSQDSVKLVDVCADACLGAQLGMVTVDKTRANHLSLTWWHYSEDFHLGDSFQIDPPGLTASRESTFEGND